MDKRTGSLFLLFYFLIPLYSVGVQVSMRVLNSDDQVTERVALNVPFVVEVAVSDEQGSIQTPQMTGIKQFILEDKGHVSTINTIINGHRSTKKIYRFSVRAARKGIFSLGPAHILIGNQRIRSDVLTLTVGEQQVTSDEPIMQLIANKERVIVGEKINVALRFYPGKSTSLDGISEPNLTGFSAEPLKGPFTGTENINSESRKYIEWRTTLYPQKSGSVTIPSVAAVYKIARKQRSRGFDVFERFFDGGLQQKQVFSNALNITIDELPPYNGTVDAIGNFDSLRASIDHSVAKEGEGIVYRLTLEGEGNLQSIEAPELTVPEGLKYYESKSYVNESRVSGNQRKIFEYILQGIKPGTFVIPAQLFTYFDLDKRIYKQLCSNEIELTVNPIGNAAKQTVTQSNAESVVAQKENNGLMPINHTGPWREQQPRQIPWTVFMVLCSMPVLVALGTVGRNLLLMHREKNSDKRKESQAFSVAFVALKKARKEQHLGKLHELFITLFAHKFGQSNELVTDDFIITCLQKGATPAIKTEWQLFFNELLQSKFGYQEYPAKKKEQLFELADQWLNRLQELL